MRIALAAVLTAALVFGEAQAAAPSRAPGMLSPLPGRSSCRIGVEFADCALARGLLGPPALVASVDGRDVYAASSFDTGPDNGTVTLLSRRPPIGDFVQPPGAAACVGRSPQTRCARARGLRQAAMDVGQAIAIAPDGRTVYAGGGDGLVVLARNRSTGTLRQLVGRDGCIAAGVRGCATTTGIGEVHAIAVSPDGRNVYATVAEAESANDVLLTLRRNRNTGVLRPVHGRGGCIGAPGAVAGCAPARAAEFIDDLVVSRDGRHVYAIGVDLVAFRRDPRSGSLTQLGGRRGCIARTGGCQRVRGILNSQALAIAPDDRHVYVTAGGDRGRLVVLVRDRRTGALRQLAGRAGCLAAVRRAGCTHAAGLSADAIAVSPDGRNVYTGGDGLVTLLRRPTTGALTPVGRLAARFGGLSLAIPPDGRNVYATSESVGTETTPTIGIIMALARSP